MGKKYQRSSFYLGTRLWDALDKTTQEVHVNIPSKGKIDTLYKKYCPLI